MPKNPQHGDLLEEEASAGDAALEQTDVLPPTTTVGGKYQLGRLLGEGGMGAVYEAEHTGLGIKVAVKLLNDMFTSDPSAVQRFRREARAAAAIRHPNIVEVTDTGEDDGVPFIVMELLEGESLSAMLRRERVLSPAVASLVIAQILAGLAAAHDKGVVHRDLKPGNILFARLHDGTHQVKILDFGISKFNAAGQDVTALGAVIGTPRFMSPEQAKGQADIDARADLYAVGVLSYRMLTGKLPFAAPTQEEVIRLILEGQPLPPRQLRPEIPEELERVVLKAMQADRDQRYPDARAFLADLQAAMPEIVGGGTIQFTGLTHTGITAGPTPLSLNLPSGRHGFRSQVTGGSLGGLVDMSTRPTTPSGVARPRGWKIIAVVLALSVLGGLGAGFYFWRRSRPSPSADLYSGPPLRFGITRYLPENQLQLEHAPLVQYLSSRLQRPVELKIFEDYVDLSSQLASGQLDLAALTSYMYVRAKRRFPSMQLLATHLTSGASTYEGYIVVKASSGIETLHGLKGKTFCYVGPNSSSGYLYPRAVLRQHGLDPDKTFKATRFNGDHPAALKAVESGACDGAAVFAGLFFDAKKHGIATEQYTILARTPRIPYDAYVVPPGSSSKLAAELKEALLALGEGTELSRRVLGEKSRITGFIPVDDAHYNPVREIEKYLSLADLQPGTTPHKR